MGTGVVSLAGEWFAVGCSSSPPDGIPAPPDLSGNKQNKNKKMKMKKMRVRFQPSLRPGAPDCEFLNHTGAGLGTICCKQLAKVYHGVESGDAQPARGPSVVDRLVGLGLRSLRGAHSVSSSPQLGRTGTRGHPHALWN